MHSTKNAFIRIVSSVLFAIFALSDAAHAEPLIRPGGRLVFIGDSITEKMIYTRYVMNYFALRYPDSRTVFRNTGWSGEKSEGGLRRLDMDVLPLKPDVVCIAYGMNDANYTAFDRNTCDGYLKNISEMISKIRKSGAKPLLITPGVVDPDQIFKWKLFDGNVYNETLARFADELKSLAAKESVPVFDLHALMRKVQDSAKKKDPKFTMIPDKIHPSDPGMAIIAYAVIKAMDCASEPSSLRIDASTGVAETVKCEVADLKVTDGKITFTRKDNALPTYVDPDAKTIFQYFPFEEELNNYDFKIVGLGKGEWNLKVENMDVGCFTSDELNSGVNLAGYPGPWDTIGKTVNDLNRKIEECYHFRWKDIDLRLYRPETQVHRDMRPEVKIILDKVDSILQGYENSIAETLSRRTWKWELTQKSSSANPK